MAPNNLHTTHAPDIFNWIWDEGTSEWIKQTASSSGGGGAATIADGADVAEGSKGDAAWVSGSGSVISILKTIASTGASSGLTDTQLRATPVPVSAASLPLPTGAATSALQPPRSVTSTGTVTNPFDTFALVTTGMASLAAVLTTGPDGQAFYFEGTADGTNWNRITVESTYSAGNTDNNYPNIGFVNTDLAPVEPLVRANIAGLVQVRVNKQSGTSASTWVLTASPESFVSIAPITKITSSSGAHIDTNAAGALKVVEQNPILLGDGTTSPVAVKAASTAAVASDKALVVAVSPNNTPVLPTGAATEAGHLATIDTKTPALGQALAAASSPVVLTAAQLTTLTPLTTVAVTSAGLTNLDVALSTRTKPADQQHAIIDSGTTTVTQATGTNLHVVVDSAPSTVVTGPLTDTQLRASAVPVSEVATASNASVTWTSASLIGSTVTLSVLGLATALASFQKTGTITGGAVTLEYTNDGTNFYALIANQTRVTAGGPFVNPYNLSTGIFPYVLQTDASAWTTFRARLSTVITSTGSITVRLDATSASASAPTGTVTVSGSVAQGNNNGSIGQSWNTQVTDGTNGPAAVKAASTAAAATDPALVVALSPNGAIVQANAGTNLNTSALALDATLTGRTQKTQLTDGTRDGTVKAASTLPALTDTAIVTTQRDPLPAGTNVLGHVIADTGSTTAVTGNVTVVQATGTNLHAVLDTTSTTAVTQATPANLQATVTPIALTKGTQGATGFSVQDLRDAGRNTRIFMLDTITAAPVAEAVATVVQWYGNAAVAGTTQPAVVPAGKTLRLTGYKIQYQSLATVGYAVVRIRCNTAGLGVLASPLVASFEAGSNAGATTVAMTGAVSTETGSFPEGLEIPAAAGLAFSVAGYGPTGTLTLEGGVRFEVHGYEY